MKRLIFRGIPIIFDKRFSAPGYIDVKTGIFITLEAKKGGSMKKVTKKKPEVKKPVKK